MKNRVPLHDRLVREQGSAPEHRRQHSDEEGCRYQRLEITQGLAREWGAAGLVVARGEQGR